MMKKQLILSDYNVQELNIVESKQVYGKGLAWDLAKMAWDYFWGGGTMP